MLGMTSIWHWLIVLVIVLVIFGPGKLPQIGEGLGKGIRNFKKAVDEGGEIEVEKREKLTNSEEEEKKQG
jgi:sec-independent protein translocase protein TatA